MTETLVPLEPVEKLSSRVIRVLGGNPSKVCAFKATFTGWERSIDQLSSSRYKVRTAIRLHINTRLIRQGTNTYIVGTGARRLLIDTGEGKPQWITSLKSFLDKDISIDKALLTHWHHDHVGGVQDLLRESSSAKIYKKDPEEGWIDIEDGQKFEVEGATLRAFHCPGHTTDHMAFVLEEEDAMFTADNVLGQGTSVFEDYYTYMKSLDNMSTAFKGRAYPGHGPVIEDGPAKVREYIEHRKLREKQVLDVLADKKIDEWTAMDIVKVVYKNYPENLWAPAERGILMILGKLLKEGKVGHDDRKDTWWLSEKSWL